MQTFSTDSIPDYVKVKDIIYENTKYIIYNLESEYIPNFNLKNRIYRSAITMDGKLVALAPSKSLPNDVFQSDVIITSKKFVVNEIIEGTMINLFWNGETWEIATKKNVGGNYFFFRNNSGNQQTFRQMFLEAFLQLNQGAFDLQNLPFDKSYCYSFVLQHPNNHIVRLIKKPKLYFVHCYKLGENNSFSYVNPKEHPNYADFVKLGFEFPRNLMDDYQIDEINKWLENPMNDYTNLGIMITDQETGLRTAYYNKKYLEVKALRGNNPSLHFQYLMLRKVGKVSEFLKYFPCYRKQFNSFYEHFRLFSERIYKLYWCVHVKKSLWIFDLVDKHDRFFVEKLHYDVFLLKHKEDKKFYITRKEVISFLDSEKMFIPIG